MSIEKKQRDTMIYSAPIQIVAALSEGGGGGMDWKNNSEFWGGGFRI